VWCKTRLIRYCGSQIVNLGAQYGIDMDVKDAWIGTSNASHP
jgi:hypothetical protein